MKEATIGIGLLVGGLTAGYVIGRTVWSAFVRVPQLEGQVASLSSRQNQIVENVDQLAVASSRERGNYGKS